jgi:purine-binding chemotaxis protein CheW
MVLIPDAFDNTSVGMIVDEVHSVLTIDENNIDTNVKGVNSELSDYVHGIIKLSQEDTGKAESGETGKEEEKRLIIWIDVRKILMETIETTGTRQE